MDQNTVHYIQLRNCLFSPVGLSFSLLVAVQVEVVEYFNKNLPDALPSLRKVV